jgi:hypothetical protein
MGILPLSGGFFLVTVITRHHLPGAIPSIPAVRTIFIMAHITGVVDSATAGAGKPDAAHLEAIFQPVPEPIFTPRGFHELAVFCLG